MNYQNGDIYEGKWQNNMRYGNGKITVISDGTGDVYEGEWVEDILQTVPNKFRPQ
jgi:hypothetical protein